MIVGKPFQRTHPLAHHSSPAITAVPPTAAAPVGLQYRYDGMTSRNFGEHLHRRKFRFPMPLSQVLAIELNEQKNVYTISSSLYKIA